MTTTQDERRQKLCEVLQCATAEADTPTAILTPPPKPLAKARAALILNPASAYRWADLGDAEMDAKQVEGGKFCVRQALAAAPSNPAILFRAANFYLRVEDYPEALRNLLAVLRNPDLMEYYDSVFALYSRMDMPLDKLLNDGLPKTPQAANAFLRFWVNQNRLEEAEATWTWIKDNSLTSLQSAGSYVALLAKDNKWDEGLESWRADTERLDASYSTTNWVYNGSFEMTPVDCPFDWHLESREAVEVSRDTEQAYKGGVSLQLRYSGMPKEGDPQAYQFVLLKPGKWEIKAAMKTRGLTGEQGVVIRVVDAEDSTRLDVATDTFQRTQEWTGISKTFDVPQGTHVARVEVVRPAARDLDVRLSGSVWVDAVTLAPVM